MTKESIKSFAEICQSAARKAGEVLLQARQNFSIREKAPNDLVTNADIESQKVIEAIVKSNFPDHGFVGEEQTEPSENKSPVCRPSEFRWIVDPLDGTINYIHGLQSYSVSIALQKGQELLVGAVYDPILDEMFFASIDGRPTLNGEPIEPSGCTELDSSLLAISLPSKARRGSPELEEMLNLLEGARSIRRLGSAALNLCYVAAGRLDGYLASSLRTWDIAAGSLIVQRAGAEIRHGSDKALDLEDPRIIAAATAKLWRQIHQQVQR